MTPRLTAKDRWIDGSGDLGFSLTNTILNVYLALFLTGCGGCGPRSCCGGLFCRQHLGLHQRSGHRLHFGPDVSRWGRRRPFLLFGALPFAAAFCRLWWRPPFDTSLALGIYYAAAFALFPHSGDIRVHAVLRAYAGVDGRLRRETALTSTWMFFSILGSLLAFTIPLWIVGSFQPIKRAGSCGRERSSQWWLPCRSCSFFGRIGRVQSSCEPCPAPACGSPSVRPGEKFASRSFSAWGCSS